MSSGITASVTYLDCNNKGCTVVLYDMEWQIVRGVRVLRGQQKIRGKFIRRSIAASEVLPNGIRVKPNKRKEET